MGEYDAVSAARRFALLADQITELTRRIDELSGKEQHRDQERQDITAAKAAIARLNARFETEVVGPGLRRDNDIKKLRADLCQVRAEVAGLLSAVKKTLDDGKAKAPAVPRWDNLSEDQEAAQLAALREWVNGTLRVQYPGYKLADCWEEHREALWELGALHAEWRRVFDNPHGPATEDTLWFHERWLNGVLARLDKAIGTGAMGNCSRHHDYGTNGRKAARR